jgi:uncharacterized protein (DUF433 family)
MTQTVPRRGQANQREANPRSKTAGRRTSPEAKKRIVDAYQAGVSIKGIVATFGHAKSTVHRALSEAGVTLRDDAARPKISREQLIQRHQEGWTPRMIADAHGLHIATVHARMAELGLKPPPRIPELPMEEILSARTQGRSIRSLAAQYGVQRETIARQIAATGVSPATPAPVISPWKLADLCRRGMTTTEMSAATGIGKKTIRKHLAAAGMHAADKRPGRERPAYVPETLLGGRA